MRCWICDAEPSVVDARTFSDVGPVLIVSGWPGKCTSPTGHRVTPPTPGELEQAGHEALMRIREEGLRG